MSNSKTFLHFLIYTDSGSLLYKLSSGEEIEPSMMGILQAIFFTSEELKCGLRSISTETGLITFNSYKSSVNGCSLMFALVLPNYFGAEEVMEITIMRLFDYVYSMLVIHIGLVDLFTFNNPREIETLKKLLNNFQLSFAFILNNFTNLNYLLQCERKFEICSDLNYPIKHYLEQYKNFLKVDFMCLCINNSVVWSTQHW